MKAIVAALALAALAAVAFVAEVRRIAAGLDVTPEEGVAPLDIRLVTVSYPGSIPTTTVTDWDAWMAEYHRTNPDWRN